MKQCGQSDTERVQVCTRNRYTSEENLNSTIGTFVKIVEAAILIWQSINRDGYVGCKCFTGCEKQKERPVEYSRRLELDCFCANLCVSDNQMVHLREEVADATEVGSARVLRLSEPSRMLAQPERDCGECCAGLHANRHRGVARLQEREQFSNVVHLHLRPHLQLRSEKPYDQCDGRAICLGVAKQLGGRRVHAYPEQELGTAAAQHSHASSLNHTLRRVNGL
eukprot:5008841-Pleurochrysis_carterae.AAC.3